MRRRAGQRLKRAAIFLVFGVLALTMSLSAGVLAAHMLSPSDDRGSSGILPLLRSEVTTESTDTTVSDADSSGQPERSQVAFVHSATPENIMNNWTYIDHPLIDGKPSAVVLVTRARGPGGRNYPHEIGVWYTDNRGGKWTVFNQDLAPMPEGAEFEIAIAQGEDRLVHRATFANTVSNITYIDDPLTNGNPGVILSVTQNWNPGGGAGVYNDHPVGTVYDEDLGQWAVYNEDLAALPVGAAFNVAVSQPSESTGGTAAP